MISIDSYILEFVGKNALTIGLVITFLKGVAKLTPWAWDDSLISLAAGLIPSVRKNNKLNEK